MYYNAASVSSVAHFGGFLRNPCNKAYAERIRINHAITLGIIFACAFLRYNMKSIANPNIQASGEESHRGQMRAAIREVIETIILSLLLFIGIQFAVQTYQVEGASMRPTLAQGQYLLVNKLVYRHLTIGSGAEGAPIESDFGAGGVIFPFHPPQHGEVVIFSFPNDPSRYFVKRVIGVPGDTVEIFSGQTYVNGKRIKENYADLDNSEEMDAIKVPANSYFVMGDNRPHSNDSRDWGTVPLENIVGRAWVRYWPPHQIGIFTDAHSPGHTEAATAAQN